MPILKVAQIALKMGKKMMQAAAKKAGQKAKDSDITTKIIVLIIVLLLMFVLFVVIAVQMALTGILCWGLLGKLNDDCPKPLTDEKYIAEIGDELYRWRNEVVRDNEGNAEAFRPYAASQVDLEEEERHTEAEMYMLILEQLDTTLLLNYGTNKKIFDEGGEYGDTNYGRYMQHAKDKKKKKNIEPFFMEKRAETWACFLLGDIKKTRCQAFVSKDMKDQGYEKGIMLATVTNKVKDSEGNEVDSTRVKHSRLHSILEKYYDLSLYKGLENGKELYDEMLENILGELEFLENFPPQSAGKFGGFSVGWATPMEPGTYRKSSPYGMRMHPIDNILKLHAGTDLGTGGIFMVPIYAAESGTVMGAGYHSSLGGTVGIAHNNGYFSSYSHMKTKDIVVKIGDPVQKGQLIGALASEGTSTAAHLHFEICTNMSFDPAAYTAICSGSSQIDSEGDPINIRYNDPFDSAYAQEKANEFDKDMRKRAKDGEIIVRPGIAELGFIAAEYESRGQPDICVNNEGDAGGLSCGTFQIATNTGTMNDFLNHMLQHYPEMGTDISKYDPKKHEEKFGENWKKVYEDYENEFYLAQHSYIYATHYAPIVEGIKVKGGFDTYERSAAVHEMIWSMGVHVRYATYMQTDSFGASILKRAGLDEGKWEGMDDRKIINKMFEGRREQRPDSRFVPRFRDEEIDILEYFEQIQPSDTDE